MRSDRRETQASNIMARGKSQGRKKCGRPERMMESQARQRKQNSRQNSRFGSERKLLCNPSASPPVFNAHSSFTSYPKFDVFCASLRPLLMRERNSFFAQKCLLWSLGSVFFAWKKMVRRVMSSRNDLLHSDL